ncbi:hypothetical protein CHARACLAT_024403 [Characodon lateralis]|uniref:Uncharacterized protein n=1 Tax=Characodon lateralis TaxID=208331 RepID=A0ABU7ECI7_9TELE|nr:hypothetical protein [Characodon lateralis]
MSLGCPGNALGTGGGVWGEGRLDVSAESAAPATRSQIKRKTTSTSAAAEFAKTHLAEALRQQLLTYERERDQDREKDKDEKKERGGLSYPSILEQQILTLDREMLDKLSANYNEAGLYLLSNSDAHKIYIQITFNIMHLSKYVSM